MSTFPDKQLHTWQVSPSSSMCTMDLSGDALVTVQVGGAVEISRSRKKYSLNSRMKSSLMVTVKGITCLAEEKVTGILVFR